MTRPAAAAALVAALVVVACSSSELASTPPDGTAAPGSSATSVGSADAPIGTAPPPTPATAVSTTASTVAADTSPSVPRCLDELSTRDLLAMLVWPAVYPEAWDEAVAVIDEHRVGGVLLMGTDTRDAGQTRDRLLELDAHHPFGVVVATDEEGGVVQRLPSLGELPSQQSVSESLSPDEAFDLIARHAQAVGDVGVDVVFAPVVDVVPTDGDVPLDRSRLFTGDASTVTDYAAQYVDAWSSSGVIPVLKHFPGHGTASADTHDDAGVTAPLTALEASDLVPYRELVGRARGVMVGHLTVPGLTGDLPASRSPAAVGYLRDTLGYRDALVVSDALGMAAVGVGLEQAAVDSIVAGVDVVLFTDTSRTGSVLDALETAVEDGRLTGERVGAAASRVLRLGGAERAGCTP